MAKTREELHEEEEVFDDTGTIYSDESREDMVDEDEIDSLEEGFMQGYDEGEASAKCALCKKVLTQDFVEEEINGKIYRFCSEEHADLFIKKQKEKEEE